MSELRKDPRLRNAVEGLNKLLDLRVRDIMQTDVVTLDSEDLLATAARTLIENKINGVVVMHKGKVYSILSSWDLLHQSYLETFSDKMDYLKAPLIDLIDDPVYEAIAPSATLANAVSVIARTNVRKLPVIENDELVGVVSIMDIFKVYDKMILTDR